MAYATARHIDPGEIPVIDIAPLRSGRDPLAVGQALRRASAEVGFLYVANHGIDERVFERARRAAYGFFGLPLEEKLRSKVNENHRGFIRIGEAFMTEDARQDLKESFVWGLEPEGGWAGLGNPLPAPNLWPDAPPDFEPALTAYFEEVEACALDLLRGFALAFGLPEEAFIGRRDWPISRAAVTYYPPQPEDLGESQFGVAPHTDYGCLTVLCQDEVGGLQVQARDGSWLAATPIPGTLVVNVGDLLSRWTNGKLRSTPHRVVNASGRERLSLVFAYDPNYETLVDPAMVCAEGEAPREPAISCGDYIQARMDRSFRYRGKGAGKD